MYTYRLPANANGRIGREKRRGTMPASNANPPQAMNQGHHAVLARPNGTAWRQNMRLTG